MASSLLKLIAFLSLVVSILLALHAQTTLSVDIEDEDEEYVLDTPPVNFRSRSRFLASVIKKGKRCHAERNNICNGVSANKGTGLLYCCKKHCRNVLGDKNNCGKCGNKCKFGQSCCNGKCTNVIYNADHCGKCKKKCAPGVKCQFGTCGGNRVDALFLIEFGIPPVEYTESRVCVPNKESLNRDGGDS